MFQFVGALQEGLTSALGTLLFLFLLVIGCMSEYGVSGYAHDQVVKLQGGTAAAYLDISDKVWHTTKNARLNFHTAISASHPFTSAPVSSRSRDAHFSYVHTHAKLSPFVLPLDNNTCPTCLMFLFFLTQGQSLRYLS